MLKRVLKQFIDFFFGGGGGGSNANKKFGLSKKTREH